MTFTKFGERYCLSASYHPKAYYGSKYDGMYLSAAWSDSAISWLV